MLCCGQNVDRAETIKILTRLLEVSTTPYQKIRVLLATIASRLDYSANLASIPHDSWVSALHETNQLITMLLSEHKEYVVAEETEEYDDMIERTPTSEGVTDGRVKVRGSLISFVENLDNEFTKTLQNSDQHGSEYVERLREERPLYETIVKAQVLFEREGWSEPTARAVMRRLEHVYSKVSPRRLPCSGSADQLVVDCLSVRLFCLDSPRPLLRFSSEAPSLR
jgi:translation initiation factor 3 subunit C